MAGLCFVTFLSMHFFFQISIPFYITGLESHQRLLTTAHFMPRVVRKVKVQSSRGDKGKKEKRQLLLHFTKQKECFLSVVVTRSSDRAPSEICGTLKKGNYAFNYKGMRVHRT